MADHEPVILSGRYELHSRIARGGMAEVYLARDQLLDRPVAIKVLFPEFAVDPAFVERFRREAQSAANLNHSAIVGVYDWGSYEGTYFIVMEYVRGRSLAEILRAEGTLHPDRAADIAIDIAGALYFAHRNGVVHRDIKPGNVLISPQGQVKVTDFGIARAMTATTNDNLTQTGSVMGTATYFSPEQAQGLAVDPRSDLYSLGIVLYEMLAGRPPFSGESPVAIAYKHVQEAPVPVREVNPAVPIELEAICMKLVAKNPVNRYASAEELRADVRRFREGHPVRAEPIMDANAVAATSAVPGLAAAALGGAAMAGAGGRTLATGRANPYGQLRGDDGTTVMPGIAAGSEEFDPPRRNWVFVVVLVGLLAMLGALLFVLARVLSAGDDGGGSVPLVDVPNVVDLDVTVAEQTLRDRLLTVRIERVTNTDVEMDKVISQNPVGGQSVEEGSIVELKVSAAETQATMPDVVGSTAADARRILTEQGFTAISPNETRDSDRSVDEVLDQDPPALTKVDKSTPVKLIVSGGPKSAQIPSAVAGKSCEDAKKVLTTAGFAAAKLSCQDTPSADVDKGKAIGTDPTGEVPLTAEIKILISSGKAKVKVPSVVGLTQGGAESQLQSAGLQVKVEFEPRADRVDRVIAQAPSDGSDVEAGSTVTIRVGTAPATTTTNATTTTTSNNNGNNDNNGNNGNNGNNQNTSSTTNARNG